jgi:predicted nucleotidyltransferase
MSNESNLASLLFGSARREILALLLPRPEASLHVRELGRLTGKAPGTLTRELAQLAEARVLLRKPVGNQVHYQANRDCPIYGELRGILRKTSGIAEVLREALEPLAGRIELAFIFGGVARGDERAGTDLDLMVVGQARFAELVPLLQAAADELRREINPSLYPPAEFRRRLAVHEPFLERVIGDDRIFVIGDRHDLGGFAPRRKAERARRRGG